MTLPARRANSLVTCFVGQAIVVLVVSFQLATAQSESLRVTFLGTGGGPVGRAEYAGPATLIE